MVGLACMRKNKINKDRHQSFWLFCFLLILNIFFHKNNFHTKTDYKFHYSYHHLEYKQTQSRDQSFEIVIKNIKADVECAPKKKKKVCMGKQTLKECGS